MRYSIPAKSSTTRMPVNLIGLDFLTGDGLGAVFNLAPKTAEPEPHCSTQSK